MGELDDILIVLPDTQAEITKQQIKDLILEAINEVNDEAFRVGGAIKGNDLISEGFRLFHKEIRDKVIKL